MCECVCGRVCVVVGGWGGGCVGVSERVSVCGCARVCTHGCICVCVCAPFGCLLPPWFGVWGWQVPTHIGSSNFLVGALISSTVLLAA